MKKQELYSQICQALTNFEQIDFSNLESTTCKWEDTKLAIDDMYETLAEVQNAWNEFAPSEDELKTLYVLVSVCECDIWVKTYWNLENAQKALIEEFDEACRDNQDECWCGRMEAWIRDGVNHDNYDWVIHPVYYPILAHDPSNLPLRIPCSYGTLVASQTGDSDIYDEIAIDIEFPDNSAMQLARVGTVSEEGLAPELHVYGWDGSTEDPNAQLIVDIDSEFRY